MRFWKGWALWQKLSIVLAILITIVLVYSFAILIRNRRKTRKHAEAEESEKAERDAELHPMVTNSSDIPFGARALERGVQVDGIWVSNNTTPVPSPQQPSTPTRSQGPSQSCDSPLKEATTSSTSSDHVMDSDQEPNVDEPSVPDPPAPPINSPVSEPLSSPEVRHDHPINNGPHRPCHNLSHVEQYPPLAATLRNAPQVANDRDMNPIKKFARNSWINKSPDASKRMSILEVPGITRRRSSEEFRRRMSKLFDDNVQVHGVDSFKLNPEDRVQGNDRRQSNFGPTPRS